MSVHTNHTYTYGLHQAQANIAEIITQLDNHLWRRVAVNNILKMRPHMLAAQSSDMLKDFAFVNAQMQLQADTFKEEDQQLSPPREKQLAGFAELIKRTIQRAAAQTSHEIPKKLPARKKNRIQTQQALLTTSVNLENTKTNSFFQMFISEPLNEQETKRQDLMRISKNEIQRYNQQMERMEKEKQLVSEQRRSLQQKKARQSKQFTYDYEGKILGVSAQQGGNLKVLNTKSLFKTTLKMPRMNKTHLQHKLYSTDKVATINNKRLVSGQSKLSYDQDDINHSKMSHKGRLPFQLNMGDLFKDGKQMEMGVSITDLANQSKILGENNCKPQDKMNLSQFKELKSAFKPRTRNLTQMIKNTDSKLVHERVSSGNSRRTQLMAESQAESKLVSSSFSHFMQRSGLIKKNGRAYTENFVLQ